MNRLIGRAAVRRFADRLDDSSSWHDGTDVAITQALRQMGNEIAVRPDPQFRDALRARLVAVATVRPVAETTSTPARGRAVGPALRGSRRVAALAGSVAVVTSVAGVGVAAARSLPGAPFYHVKLAAEQVQLWTARGDDAKGRRHLEFAGTRLAEARALSHPSAAQLATAVAAMESETTAGSRDLAASYSQSRSPEPLQVLHQFVVTQRRGILALAASTPALTASEEHSALVTVTTVQHRVRQLRSSCQSCVGARGPGGQPHRGPAAGTSVTPHPGHSAAPAPAGHPSSAPVHRRHQVRRSPSPSPAPTSTRRHVLPPVPGPTPTLPVAPLPVVSSLGL